VSGANLATGSAEGSAAMGDQVGAENTPREEGSGQREKRSRDRYGRDRKPRTDRAERSESTNLPGQEAQAIEADTAMEQEPARKSYFSAPTPSPVPVAAAPVLPAPTAPVMAALEAMPESAQPLTPAPRAVAAAAPVPALVATVVPTPAPAPAAKPEPKLTAMPAVQAFALPLDELAQVAEQSGLQWVQSDASKVASVQATIAAAPKPAHVPRARPALPVLDEKPLVLVETKRDLREQKLPFEQTEEA
jgi:ribonuclease E